MSIALRRLVALAVVFCVVTAGLVVPVGAQSTESSTTPPSPPDFAAGGLIAGLQRGVESDEQSDEFIVVPVEQGPPPVDGPHSEEFGRLDASETDNTAMEENEERDPAPIARRRWFHFPSGPVYGKWESAPEGFEGIAPCGEGYPCGQSQLLPPPHGLACWATSTEIALTWNQVAEADDYTARFQVAVAGERQTAKTTDSTWVVFSGLSPSTRYFTGVHSNRNGVDQYYSGVYCTTAVGSPICGAVSANGIELRWRADERVHRWYVARATTADQFVGGRSLAGSELSAVFRGLEEDATYKFYFWWQGSPGGRWTQVHPSTACTTMAPPPRPSISCAAAVSSITVTWESLEKAASYRVSRGSGWASPSGLSHTFSNLIASTTYSVRVQGGNSAGWGDSGEARCTTAPATLPALAGLSCSTTSTAIKFAWNAVEEADSYVADIQLAKPESPQTKEVTTSDSAVFAGLMPATKYWVTVLAVENGSSQQSTGVYCSTLASTPPPSVTCVAMSSSIAVYWKNVAGVSKYRAKLDNGAWTPDVEGTNYEFAALASGTLYKITVQSGNIGGWGRGSAVECATAAAGVGCGEATDSSVVLEWEARPDARHWYAARVDGGYVDGRMISGQQSTEFTGLAKGTRYVLLLWWHDGDGWHPITPSPECYTNFFATPIITDSSTGGTTLTIHWQPVEGAEVYEARIWPSRPPGESEGDWPSRPPGPLGFYEFGDWELVISTGTFHTFYGLTPGTEYWVEVRARRWDMNPLIWEATDPDYKPPEIQCEAATATSITISWSDSDGHYHWQTMLVAGINQVTEVEHFAKGGATTAEFTGLQSDTKYWVVIWRRAESSNPWEPYASVPYCHTTPAS